MHGGQAFAFSPIGIVRIEDQPPVIGDEPAPAIDVRVAPAAPRALPPAPGHMQAPTTYPSAPVLAAPSSVAATPATKQFSAKSIKRDLRTRIRDLDRQLSAMPKIKQEREELQRLLDAMNAPKPAPRVLRLRAASGHSPLVGDDEQ